jgi:hypothetical protein
MRVGREQVAVKGKPQKLVVEADRIVADAGGPRPVHLGMDCPDRLVFAVAGEETIGADAVDQDGPGRGNHIRPQPNAGTEALEFVQAEIGADGRKFENLVEGPIQARGFGVVEEKRVGHTQVFASPAGPLSRKKRRAAHGAGDARPRWT